MSVPAQLRLILYSICPARQRPGIQPKLQSLRALYQGKKIIVGRDKLDAVKGVVQKLRAFEKLLQDYPEWIGNVRFMAKFQLERTNAFHRLYLSKSLPPP